MSLIINQPEAQLRKVPYFSYLSIRYFLYQTKRTKYRILNLVVYDPKEKEIMIKGRLEEALKMADVEITSIGSTKDVVRKRKLDLGNKDMFVYDAVDKGWVDKEWVDLYIPITYFSGFEVSSYLDGAACQENTTQAYYSTAARLYFKDESDNTIKLGSVVQTEIKKIRCWFNEDIRMYLQKKRQLFEREEKEFLQLCEEKADESEFMSFKDKWEEKNDDFEQEHSLGLFDNTPFID